MLPATIISSDDARGATNHIDPVASPATGKTMGTKVMSAAVKSDFK
jgi:hypothetical protein